MVQALGMDRNEKAPRLLGHSLADAIAFEKREKLFGAKLFRAFLLAERLVSV